MPRLFVEPDPENHDRARLDADGVRHLRALRLTVGDEIETIVGPGTVRVATIEKIDRGGANLSLGADVPTGGTDPQRDLILVIALADLGRFDTVIEKATELGATHVLPVRAERSQIDTVTASRRARWKRIARSACEQCGRTRPPVLSDVVPLDAIDDLLPEGTRRLVLSPDAESPWNGDVPADAPLAIFVGPEGGFSPTEFHALRAAGAEPRSLGPRILRFETAAIAALALAGVRSGHLE